MRHADRRWCIAEDQIEVAVAGQVSGPGADRFPYRERLTSLSAEPFGSAPQDQAAIVFALGEDEVEPTVVVQVARIDEQRAGVFFIQSDTLGLGLESVGTAVEDLDFGFRRAAENEIQIAVAVEVGTAGPVGQISWQDPFGWRAIAIVVVKDVGTGIARGGVVSRIDKDEIGAPVVVDIAAQRTDATKPGQVLPSRL